jgi:hypothetical protein
MLIGVVEDHRRRRYIASGVLVHLDLWVFLRKGRAIDVPEQALAEAVLALPRPVRDRRAKGVIEENVGMEQMKGGIGLTREIDGITQRTIRGRREITGDQNIL